MAAQAVDDFAFADAGDRTARILDPIYAGKRKPRGQARVFDRTHRGNDDRNRAIRRDEGHAVGGDAMWYVKAHPGHLRGGLQSAPVDRVSCHAPRSRRSIHVGWRRRPTSHNAGCAPHVSEGAGICGRAGAGRSDCVHSVITHRGCWAAGNEGGPPCGRASRNLDRPIHDLDGFGAYRLPPSRVCRSDLYGLRPTLCFRTTRHTLAFSGVRGFQDASASLHGQRERSVFTNGVFQIPDRENHASSAAPLYLAVLDPEVRPAACVEPDGRIQCGAFLSVNRDVPPWARFFDNE